MTELIRLGIRMEASGDRLRYSPRSAVTPELAGRMKAHKGELLAILRRDPKDLTDATQVCQAALDRKEGDPLFPPDAMEGLRPNKARRGDWPADVAAAGDFALLLTPDDLPTTPFDFGGGHCTVVDAGKFLRWLQADVRRGPTGPRAMYGAIQGDLRRLQGMLATVTRQMG